MYLPLTDVLTCPRCGPEHGLILLADRIVDRRVLEGRLGCPKCRENYPVTGGFADLRTRPEAEPIDSMPPAPEPVEGEPAMRLAALLGVTHGGYVLVAGEAARRAAAIAVMVEGLEVVTVDERLAGWDEENGVSRLGADDALPLRSRSMLGAAVSAPDASRLLEEAARLVGARGRLVVEDAPDDVDARLDAVGFDIVARQGSILVATRR